MNTLQSHHRLQQQLQLVAQSLHWTYTIFWHLCPQKGVLVWREGYYNGAIKTRKTVQPTEVKNMEDVALQRSRQLRELYDALSAGEANAPARRSCAALSPEDLTESEWFFLICISFSFPPGDGLPGKAHAERKHVWLTRANEADSRVFSRAILAQSAGIQTVVCIPLGDGGVLELGSLDKVEEDMGVVQQARSYLSEQDDHSSPALSDHSTSLANADHPLLIHTQHLPIATPTTIAANVPEEEEEEGDEDDDVDEEEDDDDDKDEIHYEDDEDGVNYEDDNRVEMERIGARVNGDDEPGELMQLEMSDGIRLGSPDDCSENLNSELGMLEVGLQETRNNEHDESFQAWQLLLNGDLCNSPSQPSGSPQIQQLPPENAHYSDTVSAILSNNSSSRTGFSSVSSITRSMNSAFIAWTCSTDIPRGFRGFSAQRTTPSQWMLKLILFSVPTLFHYKHSRGESSPGGRGEGDDHCATRFSRRSTPQEELTANHVLAERRRREKLNERFIVLRSLVPFVTKMDKASVLADTIEYVKRLRQRIQELESRNRQFEIQANKSCSSQTNDALRNKALLQEKRKLRMLDRGNKIAEVAAASCTNVQVSIIETDALLQLQCPYRDGLLLKIIQALHELKVETTSIQSSASNGVFVAEIRAKVKGRCGKKASITRVKEAIDHIFQQY